MAAEELRQFGPTTHINCGRVGGPLTQVLAQVDTGANHSCLSAALAAKLGAPTGHLLQVAAGGQPQDVPVHRCTVEFPNGAKLDADFAVLGHLAPPHDVLIGRDILALCRVEIDFRTGKWGLEF